MYYVQCGTWEKAYEELHSLVNKGYYNFRVYENSKGIVWIMYDPFEMKKEVE